MKLNLNNSLTTTWRLFSSASKTHTKLSGLKNIETTFPGTHIVVPGEDVNLNLCNVQGEIPKKVFLEMEPDDRIVTIIVETYRS